MRRHKPALDGQQEQRDGELSNIRRQVRTLDWTQKLLTGSRSEKISMGFYCVVGRTYGRTIESWGRWRGTEGACG